MSRMTRWWKLVLPLGLIAVLASVVVSTSVAASKAKEVRVAIMTDCKGAFGFGYEPDIGGAQAALANYAAGLVVMKYGTATISPEELAEAVRGDLG